MFYYLLITDNSMFYGCDDYDIFRSNKKLSEIDVMDECQKIAENNQEGYAYLATTDCYEEDFETAEDFGQAMLEAEDNFKNYIEWTWKEISEEEVLDYVSSFDEVQDWH